MGPTYLGFQFQALREVAAGFGLSPAETAAAIEQMVTGTTRTLLLSGLALLATLALVFAFQAENLTTQWLAVILPAVPITVRVCFNSSLTCGLTRLFRVPHNVASPGALIGAGNLFEMAAAAANTLFGPGSPAALACVVGVLLEVPVMPSVCRVCDNTRDWFAGVQSAGV